MGIFVRGEDVFVKEPVSEEYSQSCNDQGIDWQVQDKSKHEFFFLALFPLLDGTCNNSQFRFQKLCDLSVSAGGLSQLQ
jgi:hypothetical protein